MSQHTWAARPLIALLASFALTGCASTTALKHRVADEELRALDKSTQTALQADDANVARAAGTLEAKRAAHQDAQKRRAASRTAENNAERARDTARDTLKLREHELTVAQAAKALAEREAALARHETQTAEAAWHAERARRELNRYIALSKHRGATGEEHANTLGAFSAQLKDAEHALAEQRAALEDAKGEVSDARKRLESLQNDAP